MKILSIVWYKILPAEYGGQKGITNFNKYLAHHASLTCLCSGNNEINESASYKILPLLPTSKFQFINPIAIKQIVSIAEKERPDYIILEHPFHAVAGLKAAKKTKAKLILHSHNIESERFRSLRKWLWFIVRKYEKWIHRKADLILFKSKEDMDFACSHFGIDQNKCMTIPYGIDPGRKKPLIDAKQVIRKRHNILQGEKLIFFCGTLDYHPNAKAVENIFSEIALALEAKNLFFKILITGRIQKKEFQYLKKLNHPSVILTGEVTDIENYFAAADVFINPVQSSNGIQTKTVEALSYDLNVVCFDHMLNGIDMSLCKEKIYSSEKNNFTDFAEKIIKASSTPDSSTREEFIRKYSIPNQVEKFVARLNSV